MSATAHLHCVGGGQTYRIGIAGQRLPKRQPQIAATRRFDCEVRERLAKSMLRLLDQAREIGAERITVDVELEYELNTQNMGFDETTQQLVLF